MHVILFFCSVQGKSSGASQFMVHFNIRSRYMGEITGMKAAFQGNTDTLINLLLNNLTEAESSNGFLLQVNQSSSETAWYNIHVYNSVLCWVW